VVSSIANTTLSDITAEQGGFLNCLQGSDFTTKIVNITLLYVLTFVIQFLVFLFSCKENAVKSYKMFLYEEEMNAVKL